jgi:hypothetical protein
MVRGAGIEPARDFSHRILRSMADKKELDHDLVEFFINEKVYEVYQAKYETLDSGQSSETSPKTKKDP